MGTEQEGRFSLLDLALQLEMKRFLAHRHCQSLMTEWWRDTGRTPTMLSYKRTPYYQLTDPQEQLDKSVSTAGKPIEVADHGDAGVLLTLARCNDVDWKVRRCKARNISWRMGPSPRNVARHRLVPLRGSGGAGR